MVLSLTLRVNAGGIPGAHERYPVSRSTRFTGQSFMGLLWGCMGVNLLFMRYIAGSYPKVFQGKPKPGTKVNYWPMSLAPTNEDSAWLG